MDSPLSRTNTKTTKRPNTKNSWLFHNQKSILQNRISFNLNISRISTFPNSPLNSYKCLKIFQRLRPIESLLKWWQTSIQIWRKNNILSRSIHRFCLLMNSHNLTSQSLSMKTTRGHLVLFALALWLWQAWWSACGCCLQEKVPGSTVLLVWELGLEWVMDSGECRFSSIITRWMSSSSRLCETSTKMKRNLKDWEGVKYEWQRHWILRNNVDIYLRFVNFRNQTNERLNKINRMKTKWYQMNKIC